MYGNLIIYSVFAEYVAVYVYEVNTEIFFAIKLHILQKFREFNFCRGIMYITQSMMHYV